MYFLHTMNISSLFQKSRNYWDSFSLESREKGEISIILTVLKKGTIFLRREKNVSELIGLGR